MKSLKLFLFLVAILVAGAPDLRDIFYRMGLSDKDIVALSGAHTLVFLYLLFHYVWCSFVEAHVLTPSNLF